jgi:hypothetical protein
MTNSVNYCGAFNRSSGVENNFQNYSTYGLNYYNDSAAEYSDGYQSSISPVASPELSSCRIKNNFQQLHQNDFFNYQNFPSQQIKNEENSRKNFQSFEERNFNEIQTFKTPQKLSKPQLNAGMKKMIQTHPEKPIIVAPEVMKRRRVAANARERRRMNSLNFAFDK